MRIADVLNELYRKDSAAFAMEIRGELQEFCTRFEARARAATISVFDLDLLSLLELSIPMVIDAHETVENERNLARSRAELPAAEPAAVEGQGGPVVRSVLDLSTAHLPPRFFQDGNDLSGAYETEFGMLLWVPDDPDDSAAVSSSDDDSAPEVLAVRRYARKLGCDYIMFDRDAAVVGSLPTWEW